MKPRIAVIWILIGVLAAVLPAGCGQAGDPLDPIVANTPVAGRAATADALQAEFLAGRVTFESCLERAEALLEAGDPAATAFAGATLDLAERIKDRFPTGGEFELFWLRMGQLASKATAQAMNAGRFDEASTLVLAGPKRWQRETYWQRYPNHDIMVALSMAQQGRSQEGISRLRSRVVVTPAMDAAIEQIQELERQRLRYRLKEQIEAEQPGG